MTRSNSQFLSPTASNLSSSKERTKALLANLETPRDTRRHRSDHNARLQETVRPSLEKISSKSFYDRNPPFIDKRTSGGMNVPYGVDLRSGSSSSYQNSRTREIVRDKEKIKTSKGI
jgi:hypothetical protein